jgi:hypothetical protein
MTVRELISILQHLPDKNARVIVYNGESLRWLIATAVNERGVTACPQNPDFVVSGSQPAIEIV